MKRVTLSLMFLTACASEEGAMLQIVESPMTDSFCNASPTSLSFHSHGRYDPTGSSTYAMSIVVANKMDSAEQDSATSATDDNIRTERRVANLVGFDVCYYRADDPRVAQFDDSRNGLPLDCEDVPQAQRQFVMSAGSIEPDGGEVGVFIGVLDDAVLKALFGQAFDPASLVIGLVDANGVIEPAIDYLDFDVSSPVGAGRNAAWGEFPESRTSRVIVQVRANGKLQTGRWVRSNWFAFPVDICMGCAGSFCGKLRATTCDDGSLGFEGKHFPIELCLPYSFQSELTCEKYTTCPE